MLLMENLYKNRKGVIILKNFAFISSILVAIFSPSVFAAQFESIIDAISIENKAAHTNNDWDDTQKIKRVKWKWSYSESGAHDSKMVGKTKVGKDKNPNIGATEIVVSGTRTMINKIQLSIQNEGEDPSEEAVIKLFGKGQVKKISTTCDIDDISNHDATYQFEKSGYKPVYIRYMSSWGAGGAGGIDVGVANDIADVLDNCNVKQ